jgi:hypothetical protein
MAAAMDVEGPTRQHEDGTASDTMDADGASHDATDARVKDKSQHDATGR